MPQLYRDSPLPLYHQLLQILLDKINSGEYSPGQLLPSEKELEAEYGVSRVTIRRAMDDLMRMGQVTRQQGRGTFVTDKVEDYRSELLRGFMEDLINQGVKVTIRLLAEESIPAAQPEAGLLDVETGTPICHIRRVGSGDGIPIVLSDSWYHLPEGCRTVPELGAQPALFTALNNHFREIEGRTLVGGSKTLEATVCTQEEATLLDTVQGAPLLLVKLILNDHTGRPAVFIKARYRGDRYVYALRLRI
jgi:GntR family transcriptional regulator